MLLLLGMPFDDPTWISVVGNVSRSGLKHERASPAQLCRSVDALLRGGRPPVTDAIGSNELHCFFDAKVAAIQAATVDALPPSFTPAPSDCSFSKFRFVGVSDVIAAVRALPDSA